MTPWRRRIMRSAMSQKRDHNLLDAGAESALGKVSPQLAWEQIKALVEQAIEVYPNESQKLVEKYSLPVDLSDLEENLEEISPIRAVNEFHYSNPDFNLKDVLKAEPLQALEALIKMDVQNDRFNSANLRQRPRAN